VPAELPMNDVVKLVLQAEGESKRILEEAESRASKISDDARRRAHDLVQKMRLDTAEQVQVIVETAQQEGGRERQIRLDQAAAEIEAAVQMDDASLQTLIEAMMRCVHGTN
jgi:vacuolar-type H+-ATPase subunit H